MNARPTLDSLKADAAERLADWNFDRSDETEVNDAITEIVASVVPVMTTTLFQMVVDDNSLAFLPLIHEADTPFQALSDALNTEVTNHLDRIREEAR